MNEVRIYLISLFYWHTTITQIICNYARKEFFQVYKNDFFNEYISLRIRLLRTAVMDWTEVVQLVEQHSRIERRFIVFVYAPHSVPKDEILTQGNNFTLNLLCRDWNFPVTFQFKQRNVYPFYVRRLILTCYWHSCI